MKKQLIEILGILEKSYARFSISKFQSFQQLVSKVMFRILLSIIASSMEIIYIYKWKYVYRNKFDRNNRS